MQKLLLSSLFGLSCIGQAQASAFTSCPTQAFLVQKETAELYGVNLATGFVETLSTDMGTSGKLNAMGFNFQDNYLYAWSYQYATLARIHSDYQIEPLTLNWLTNNANTNFYVGDVALSENAYYMYRKGSGYGLYRVELDQSSANYLDVTKVTDGASLSLTIFDLAFHPDNGLLYSVDNKGKLWRVNPQDGSSEELGSVGQSGTFGAVYFDVNGQLYISRNNDGLIFQIDVASDSPQAELFAQGPSSGNNDGARCAIAPILAPDEANIDFGDAPNSYGTLLSDNGARHQLDATGIRLGSEIDGESDGFPAPNSDDVQGLRDDEDGVALLTDLRAGLDFVSVVQVNQSGYLSAWFDWNQDGQFSNDEQVTQDYNLSAGNNQLVLSVPAEAVAGNTWARFRVSSVSGLAATGGAPDGEVEDMQVYVSNQGTNLSCYPSCQDFATIAFEDNWPAEGDYDLNDVVISLQTRVLSNNQQELLQIELSGSVLALGASFHNGLAVHLPGLLPEQLETELLELSLNGEVSQDFIENSQQQVVAIISDNITTAVADQQLCDFYRTQSDCRGNGQMHFSVTLPIKSGVNLNSLGQMPFDPFIFANNSSRDPVFSDSPGRGLEIHLKNALPTELHDASLWGMYQDSSQPSASRYYQNQRGLPWAIKIPYLWRHPWERINIAEAYPKFIEFAESEGQQAQDWYLLENALPHLLYQD